MAFKMTNNEIQLNSKERKELVEILHCKCSIDEKKMWISTKHETKKAYTILRKFLINDGYIMLQSEVFMRVEDTRRNCIKHQSRLRSYLPKTGTVRMLILTEKQFSACVIAHEKPDYQEEKVGVKDFVLL